ncbi:MAG: sensor histidine kinase [Verrucomicrobiales bacterium]
MKPRLIAIFLLLVLSPLALLAWFGWRAAADEQVRVRSTISQAYANQLASLRTLVHETITGREREFSSLLTPDLIGRRAAARGIVRSQRFVRQVFVLGPDGNFAHPPADEGERNEGERQFFDRTSSIWLSGEKFTSTGEGQAINRVLAENIPAPDQSDYAQSIQLNRAWTQQQAAVQNAGVQYAIPSPTNFATDQGWYTWFHGDGAQAIYWRYLRENGYTLGIEIDREALMAEVIARLPSDTGAGAGSIVLTDASARPIYQWGGSEPEPGATPKVSIPLFAPLGMWHLNLYPPETLPAGISKSNLLSLISGLVAAAVALLALAIYFYRENSREMRTAAEKVTFVNQVSHELKTPLTNIRMYAELAEERVPEGEADSARRCLGIVVSESQRLSRLIGNVLTFAKPKLQRANPTPNIPDELIRETLEHFRPSLESQKFEIEFDSGATEQVQIDADILEQILGNLFSNVEKYAACGESLMITSRQDGEMTVITVSDRGPGIPAGQREKIFKPFHRLSNQLSDGVSGTGIGLTIARNLAVVHGGDLTLTDTRDSGGCTFTLRLKTGHT